MKKKWKICTAIVMVVVLAVGGWTLAASTKQHVPVLTPGKAHVILLGGQSNASGQSLVSFLKEKATPEDYARYEAGYDNVLIRHALEADPGYISDGFVPVKVGQGADSSKFGPELGIADYLSKTYPNEKFYIIKTCWSGTSIGGDWQTDTVVYDTMIPRMTEAFKILEDQGLEPEVFAFCWMQGEGDSVVYSYAIDYYNQLSNLYARITGRYDKYASPAGVAFVDGGISDHSEWKFHEIVNGAKQQFASEKDNRYFLNTQEEGLEYHVENNDPAHYDALSMVRLGEMFGEALAKIVEKDVVGQ